MKKLVTAVAVVLGVPAQGQEAPANAPKFVRYAKAPGVEVRYLDFRWDEEAFTALEKGGSHPAAQRSWVLGSCFSWSRSSGTGKRSRWGL